MYGKFFASTFTGSMLGAGCNVFAVWSYVIANAVDSAVEINPRLLAPVLGTTPEEVTKAIEYLCAADESSRNPEEDGRRLVKEGAFQYKVVSHHIYRKVRNEDERREYNRVKQRESRLRRSQTDVIDSQLLSSMSAHTYASVSLFKENSAQEKRRPARFSSEQIEDIYWAYPKHVAKGAALRAIDKALNRLDHEDPAGYLLAITKEYAQTPAGQNGTYTPHPATFYNESRYLDDPGEWEKMR